MKYWRGTGVPFPAQDAESVLALYSHRSPCRLTLHPSPGPSLPPLESSKKLKSSCVPGGAGRSRGGGGPGPSSGEALGFCSLLPSLSLEPGLASGTREAFQNVG